MTSSTKLEVHITYRIPLGKDRVTPQVTYAKIWCKFYTWISDIRADRQTEKTDKHTDTLIAILRIHTGMK